MDSDKKVLVYSTPTWPHCKRAKKFLEENGISFQDIDVAADKAAREEMARKAGQIVVPVFDIDGTIIVGYVESQLKEALGL